MADVILILIVIAFCALCVAYVRGLDRMVRETEESQVPIEERAE